MVKINDEAAPTPANVADGAVGVPTPPEKHWYIAIVAHRSERACGKWLAELGYQSYVASQWEQRTWRNGRKKRVERIVLPARVFVRSTEEERLKHIVKLPYINRFVTDRARKSSPDAWAPVAVVPDKELETFRRMLGQEEMPVFLEDSHVSYVVGDRVRVTSGKLTGLEGRVKRTDGDKSRLYVSLDFLGSVYVEIDKNCLEPADA